VGLFLEVQLQLRFQRLVRASEKQAGTAVYNYRQFKSEGTEDLSGNSIFYKNPHGEVFIPIPHSGAAGNSSWNLWFFRCASQGAGRIRTHSWITGLGWIQDSPHSQLPGAPVRTIASNFRHKTWRCPMPIHNAIASLAVKDLKPASQWYERFVWSTPGLEAHARGRRVENSRRAAGCRFISCRSAPEMDLWTLAVTGLDQQIDALESAGIAAGGAHAKPQSQRVDDQGSRWQQHCARRDPAIPQWRAS